VSAPSGIRPALRGDLPEIVEVLIACDIAESGEPDSSIDDLAADWSMEGFDPARDTWVGVTPSGDLVGYAYAGDQLQTGEIEADLWVHPEHQEPGLASRLLKLAERRAAELTLERGYDAPSLNVYCGSLNRGKRELLQRHDYELTHTVYRMTIDLAPSTVALPTPEGMTIKPLRANADEQALYEAVREACSDHFRPSNETFSAWRTRVLGHPDADPSLSWLAWEHDAAVGAVIAYDHGDLGWIRVLGVRQPWRRRGLGSALLSGALAELARRGRRRVDLGVDAEGATRPLRLYERAGMRPISSYELYVKRLAP